VYSVRLTASAEACFARLTPEQRRRIIRIIANVQLDPAPDNHVKFTHYDLGAMYTIYLDHVGYWVLYHVRDQTILVVGVGLGGPQVPL
jgi:hypothetical protein